MEQARRTDLGGGAAMEKLKPIASISGHFGAIQWNYNERLFDSATNQEDASIGDKDSSLPSPGEKYSKIEANCKHFLAFGAISV